LFTQPVEWMIVQNKVKTDEEIPTIGDDQENKEMEKENSRVRYLSSFRPALPQHNKDIPAFITKENLGQLQQVFGELHCPKCDQKVGYWNWMGNGCYCGHRMMPAFCLEHSGIVSTAVSQPDNSEIVANNESSNNEST